ncbi:hypothetical protein BsWGS_25605 [Bradybaena similaris]
MAACNRLHFMDKTMYALLALAAALAMILPTTSCPPKCFCSETRADCSSRQLQAIPEGIPESVESLDLRDNQITDVDAAKLAHLQSLKTLSLQINHLSKLKPLTFVSLTRLTKLYIASNKLETIDDNAFQDLPSLQYLDLADNKLSDISGKFHFARLQRLILSHNQIPSLQNDTLNGVRNVMYLILANNRISHISKWALDGMVNLVYLDLQENPIKNIDDILGGMQRLSFLNIAACQLVNIPKGLPWTLRYLKISNNSLNMIQTHDLRNTMYLEHLIADNNQIQTIQDDVLSYMPYLTEINFSYNKIKWLPQILNHIETFIADNNEIHQLFQSTFAHDSKMKILSLRSNAISEIPPNTFSRLTNLSTLNLEHNAIKHLQNTSFSGLRQLTTLNLEFNPVDKIDYRAFGGLQKLENLNLSNINSNKTVIEGAIFQDVPSLVSLYLQNSPSIINDIFNSSNLLRSLRNIQHLYLSNGSIETVSMDVKHFLPHLKSIQLSDNPLHCDSELVALHNWINESPELFANSSVICASPNHLKGRAVQDVSIQELTMPAPTQPTYSSNSFEFSVNITTAFDEIMNQSEVSTLGKLEDVTRLLQPSSTVSTIQATKSENANITPLLQTSIITSTLEIVTFPVYYENMSKEQRQVLHSMAADHYHTLDISTANPSLTSMATELDQQLFPSTAVSGLSLMPGKVTSTLQLQTLNAESSAVHTWPASQIPAKRTHEASATSSIHTSAHIPREMPHSNNLPILSATTVTSQPISSKTSTFTMSPKSAANTVPASSTQMSDVKKDVSGTLQLRSSPIKTLATSMEALPITGIAMSTTVETSALIMTSMLASNTIRKSQTATTQELPTTEIFKFTQITSSRLLTWSVFGTQMLASIPVSEHANEEPYTGITSVTEKTGVSATIQAVSATTETVPDTTLSQQEKQNITNPNRHNKGNAIKPAVKPDNRLPSISSSGDMKLRAIIITVSATLFALIVGLFIAIITMKYCKKRKNVTFDDKTKNITDIQTETSDTVFIISHMEGQHTDNLNTDTSQRGKTSTTSSKKTIDADNRSKQTKKGLKFSRQSVSAAISKTPFDCIKGQTEDDSELLMYSWT